VSVFIIAEAGVNHNGSIDLAFKLVDEAVKAGADAVKFQTFKSETLVSKNTQKAEYQKKTTNSSESQFEMLKKLELSFDEFKKINNYCADKDIVFLSSPFDHSSIDFLDELGVKFFKIPSGEITNLPYLRRIGSLSKKIILSSGMSTLKEVGEAINILVNSGTKKENISVLHANTMYPTPMEDVNLNAMQSIKNEFDIAVGYSDHTLGIEVDIAAVALGATIIEKHFTLDKMMRGPDHKASLEPREFGVMVAAIRNIEKALGSNVKTITPSEKENINIVRKSITAKCAIKKGEKLTEDNLTIKRPGSGISPMMWDKVIGTLAMNDYQCDEQI
jgi:N,N'-diacetyllegionaminate synthase